MKKILLIITLITGLISVSSKITGPRYRLEGSVGGGYSTAKNDNDDHNLTHLDLAGSFLSEYKFNINDKRDITFGPKITAKMGFLMGGARSITPSINLGAELNLNNRVKENVKVYLGLEAGIGFGLSVKLEEASPGPFLSGIAKLSVGFKINDKYNIGVYGGYGKGFAGIEAGYTF